MDEKKLKIWYYSIKGILYDKGREYLCNENQDYGLKG